MVSHPTKSDHQEWDVGLNSELAFSSEVTSVSLTNKKAENNFCLNSVDGNPLELPNSWYPPSFHP